MEAYAVWRWKGKECAARGREYRGGERCLLDARARTTYLFVFGSRSRESRQLSQLGLALTLTPGNFSLKRASHSTFLTKTKHSRLTRARPYFVTLGHNHMYFYSLRVQ